MIGTRDPSSREVVELLNDYLEDALRPGLRERVDRHLAGCNGCAGYLQQLRLIGALVGRLTEASLSPEARRTLLDVSRSWMDA